jgi:signal transduction histidine kinase
MRPRDEQTSAVLLGSGGLVVRAEHDLLAHRGIGGGVSVIGQESEPLRDDGKSGRVCDDFVSLVGHEVRTPLTVLKLQTQSLLRQCPQHRSGA